MTYTEADMTGQLSTGDAVLKFITGGNAYVTLRSRKTGVRFTYRVRVSQQALEGKQNPLPFFLSVLSGADNTGDYQFFGTMFVDATNGQVMEYRHSRKSRISVTAPSVQAMSWMLKHLERKDEVFMGKLEVWHDGRCGRCGRKLTVPESVASGFGPDCIQFVGAWS